MSHLAKRIEDTFPAAFIKAAEWRGDVAVTVKRDALHDVARFLRSDPSLEFDYIVHVSSVDWPDDEERFEVVYEVYSIRTRQRIRLKTRVPESDCVVDSLTDIWKGADFMEREVYDMMGIRFRNHPDLRRILMPDEYDEGYPLRKDFPLRGRGWRDSFDFLDEHAR
ncbi:MAG: nuoC [Nitrospira sp.]|jgi:NADH-quinone oxidoreductase subunit C|nr:nuoC [Nitrospira sp.]